MEEETSSRPTVHAHRLFVWGLIASCLYVGGLATYTWFVWRAMLAMKPDQLATFLSGVFAPLAFLWLVLGFRQQGDELQNSARALWIQSEELRNSVEQQERLVDLNREQFEQERLERERLEAEADRLAQPIFGFQRNGATFSGSTSTFDFLIANAGATCTNVKLFEGLKSRGEAAILEAKTAIAVSFHFGDSKQATDRTLNIKYNDARGREKQQTYIFRVSDERGRKYLLAPMEPVSR